MKDNLAGQPTARYILRLPSVSARTGLKRSKLYQLIKAGSFPPPIRLTSHASGWNSESVQAWIDARLDAAPATSARVCA